LENYLSTHFEEALDTQMCQDTLVEKHWHNETTIHCLVKRKVERNVCDLFFLFMIPFSGNACKWRCLEQKVVDEDPLEEVVGIHGPESDLQPDLDHPLQFPFPAYTSSAIFFHSFSQGIELDSPSSQE